MTHKLGKQFSRFIFQSEYCFASFFLLSAENDWAMMNQKFAESAASEIKSAAIKIPFRFAIDSSFIVVYLKVIEFESILRARNLNRLSPSHYFVSPKNSPKHCTKKNLMLKQRARWRLKIHHKFFTPSQLYRMLNSFVLHKFSDCVKVASFPPPSMTVWRVLEHVYTHVMTTTRLHRVVCYPRGAQDTFVLPFVPVSIKQNVAIIRSVSLYRSPSHLFSLAITWET